MYFAVCQHCIQHAGLLYLPLPTCIDTDVPEADKEGLLYQYKFVLLSEEGKLRFGCRDNADRQVWVQWIYRATGQSHQPTMEQQGEKKSKRTASTTSPSLYVSVPLPLSVRFLPIFLFSYIPPCDRSLSIVAHTVCRSTFHLSPLPSLPPAGTKELDRYGLSCVVEQDIIDVDRHRMFESLFHAILEYRLKEDAFSRVSLLLPINAHANSIASELMATWLRGNQVAVNQVLQECN